MNRRILSATIIAALAFPTLTIAQGRQCGGQGKQNRASAQQGTQQRQQKRDGTGPNCTGNCQQQQTRQQTQTQQKTETQQKTQTRTEQQAQQQK